MIFGWMMCRENDVRLNTDSIKWHSTLYSFSNFTIRQYDDPTNWHSMTWRFGKTTIRLNDVSGKWYGPVLDKKKLWSLSPLRPVLKVNILKSIKFGPHVSYVWISTIYSPSRWTMDGQNYQRPSITSRPLLLASGTLDLWIAWLY